MTRFDSTREIRAPRGTALNAKSWQTEAPLRMLMNNLDPEVAEHPQSLFWQSGRPQPITGGWPGAAQDAP